MNDRSKILLILLAVITVAAGSCKTQKKVLKEELKEHGFEYLYDKMLDNQMNFNSLNAKFTLVYEQDKNKTNLRGQLRISNDSMMWLSFTPALGIEAARVLLTNDSVKFINRLNKTYFEGEYNLVDSVLNTTIDYSLLQSMIVGNDLTQYDVNKFRSNVDNGLYRLTIRERRKIKRFMRKGEFDTRVLVQQIWLNPENYRIARIDVKEQGETENHKLRVFYDDYIEVNGQLFPSKMRIEIVSNKTILIDVDFNKVEIDEHLKFPFNIPSKYDNIF